METSKYRWDSAYCTLYVFDEKQNAYIFAHKFPDRTITEKEAIKYYEELENLRKEETL